MNNQFRCGCGGRVVCGTGDPEYDNNLQQLQQDHAMMGHNVLKPLKIPSNPIQERKMTVHDEDADSRAEDESYAYYEDELVA